ncbi:hypothetical protein [Streptomyces sp. NPDC048639]|uniref:hypothetical protein n=1 Tax=Streptomyces sp. NPDC048639 TaxID=3365581 RepID=UPI003722739F
MGRSMRYVVGAALSLLLIPLVSPAGPAGAADVTEPVPVVFDPGPKARCFGVVREFYSVTPQNETNDSYDTSGCGAVDDPARVDGNCQDRFPYTGAYGPACPAWDFVTMDWNSSGLRQYPGYDHQVWGSSGSPLTLVMQNNSRTLGDCTLREVAFSYHYPSSSLRRKENGNEYRLADGRLTVSYDAWAEQSGGFACDEKRAILTTDLIYKANGKKNVISVVHHDPGNFAGTPDQNGVLWKNDCADGCRVTVLGERIPAGSTTRISVDFTDLAGRLAPYLGHDPVPGDSSLLAVQIVNSGKGSDLQTRVSNAAVTLQPDGAGASTDRDDGR